MLNQNVLMERQFHKIAVIVIQQIDRNFHFFYGSLHSRGRVNENVLKRMRRIILSLSLKKKKKKKKSNAEKSALE